MQEQSLSRCLKQWFSFCKSLRESYCVYSRHPNPQVCLPHVPFLVRSPSFHRICIAKLFMLLLSFRPYFNGYRHDVCASLVYLI